MLSVSWFDFQCVFLQGNICPSGWLLGPFFHKTVCIFVIVHFLFIKKNFFFFQFIFWPYSMCSLSSLTRDWSRTPCKWKHGVFNYWIARVVPVVQLSNQVVSIWCLIVWVMFVSLHKPINPGKLPAPSYWGPKYQGWPVVGSQPSPAGSPLPFNLLSP